MRSRLLITLLVVALAAAACGKGGTKVDPVADKARAEKTLIGTADVGTAYKETKPDPSKAGDEEAQSEELEKCVGAEASRLDDATSAKVTGSDFEDQNDKRITSQVSVYNSEANAKSAMALNAGSPLQNCFKTFLERELTKEAQPGIKLTTGPLAAVAFESVGDQVSAFRMTVTVEAGPQSVIAPFDLVFVRMDRLVLAAFFFSVGKEFPISESQAIVTKALARS